MRTSLATFLVISAVCSTGWSQTPPKIKIAPAEKPVATAAAKAAATPMAAGPTAVIDTTADKVLTTIPVGKAPWGVAVSR